MGIAMICGVGFRVAFSLIDDEGERFGVLVNRLRGLREDP